MTAQPQQAWQQQHQRRGLSSLLLSASASPAQQQAWAAARARGVGLRGPQRRSMFIQTEATPNPESLKYLPGQVVLDEKYGTGMVRERLESSCVVAGRASVCVCVCGLTRLYTDNPNRSTTTTTATTVLPAGGQGGEPLPAG